jgi:outer membrane lipoprotein SlyB
VVSGALLALAGATGCNNAAQGALSGGTLGALGGLAIGSVTGDAGAGAVIGAVAGSIGGAVIGDQNQRAAERQDEIRSPNE